MMILTIIHRQKRGSDDSVGGHVEVMRFCLNHVLISNNVHVHVKSCYNQSVTCDFISLGHIIAYGYARIGSRNRCVVTGCI